MQDALDFAAKVRVTGRIDDVDFDSAQSQGDVLGQDGDTALALQVVGVEDALALQLAFAEQARLAHHLIDQRSLAVVHVSDDGDVTNIGPFHE